MARHSHPGALSMKIFCAWCWRDGKPGYLGEREPLENPEPTHGICAYHTAKVLASLPSRSFPDAEMLIVVSRNSTALYENLKRSLATMSSVKVIMDRRVADRRAASGQGSDERRYSRTRRVRESTISPLGDFTVVRFTPKALPAPAPLELDHRSLARKAWTQW